MKKCWDTNPNNRPSVTEILDLFENCKNDDIKKQIEEAEEFRKANLLSIENNQSTTHLKAYYTSRLLNPFTKDLPKYDNVGTSNSVEIIDFTEGLFLPQVPIGSNVELARRLVEHETCHQLNPEGD
ncbi:unnamed protein product [Rhizophagus irregularis]|uniref:Serine-threonine/tyrosine-protein kinase catalytic domain-containing protein n=1 Tax=Rhizophagus irregularis TaxID=588596 RepID=A0A915Z6J2_9GLOM|nr:unnamed protein product [Rhizophagus irregularis]